MPFSFDLSVIAADLATSILVPHRAVVGLIDGESPRFAISPPLDHVFDELIGFDAPTEWEAVAAVADIDGQPNLRTVWMADRSGRASVATAAGRAHAIPLAAGAAPVMADAVLRSLGLPTDPPSDSADLLDEVTWIDALVAHAAAGSLDVASALATQPIVLRRAGVDAWEHMHARATDESSPACRHLFSWMDTGMFSRWVFGLWPGVDELVSTLAELVEPSVAAAVMARCPEIRARLPGVGTVSA